MWSPPFEISQLKHSIHTKNNDNSTTISYIDSDSYLIRFRSSQAPHSVIYMGKRLTFELFVQRVRRWQRCQRFGYISKICRTPADKAICYRCGKSCTTHKEGICPTDSPSCINCKRHKFVDTNHEASSNFCPVFKRQKQIKNIMAFHNISQVEAEALLGAGSKYNSHMWSRSPLGVPLPTF